MDGDQFKAVMESDEPTMEEIEAIAEAKKKQSLEDNKNREIELAEKEKAEAEAKAESEELQTEAIDGGNTDIIKPNEENTDSDNE